MIELKPSRAGMLAITGIFVFINELFMVKYGARTPLGAWGASVGFLVLFGVAAGVAAWLGRKTARLRSPWTGPLVFTALMTILFLAVYLRIDPQSLQIDRWSALDHFLSALFRGQYPYEARTHLNHVISGFPGLFVLALPFYALGDVGYLQFAALFALAALLVMRRRDGGRATRALILLAAMPVFAYQVLCRSDLFGNMVATAWLMHLGSRPGAARGARLWGWALAWGLMLSTRGIVVIPMIFAAPALLKGRNVVTAAAFFGVAVGVMLATLVPFYLWDPRLFWEHNPYNVQAAYTSRGVLALVLLTSAALAYRYRETSLSFLHAGFLLFATIFVCGMLKAIHAGWESAFWNHGFDITYFSLCIPFLLPAWGESFQESAS